ncbi:MAG: ATP-dependent DNA helicase [Candidatus Bathyarchaeia archaeon]
MGSSLFPYAFREHQEDLFEFVQKEVGKRLNVIVEAATGFGKTPLILSALLPEALNQGSRILWAVRTGTETDRPVEELKVIQRRLGTREFFGLSYRGKRDMCLLLKDLKLEGSISHEDANLVCEAYKDRCPYRLNLKVQWRKSLESLLREPRLYSETLALCARHRICPYGTQIFLLDFASLISFSYNYILDRRIRSFMRTKVGFKNAILVVDEAHNLPQAAGELNSDRITTRTVERSIKELEGIEGKSQSEEGLRIGELIAFLEGLRDDFNELSSRIAEDEAFDLEKYMAKWAGSPEAFLYLADRAKSLGNRIRRRLLREGKAPRSSLYHLGDFWKKALELRNTNGVAMIASKEDEAILSIELFDMRSSEILGSLWEEFEACVFCSGTLKPLDSFAEVIGLKNHIGRVFPSPYLEDNVASFITKDLSTRGEDISDDMAMGYLEAIEAFLERLRTNVAIFASSYRIQERLLSLGLKEIAEKHGRRLFVEEQGFSGDESRRVLDAFKACAHIEGRRTAERERGAAETQEEGKGGVKGKGISKAKARTFLGKEGGERVGLGVLFGVMGGRFAEGADFPGRELEAIFLVGIPFARPNVKTRLYIKYYEDLYGKEKGRRYAYVLPALKRASQALGRALRSREDRAVFILGDERYVQYIDLLPDFIQKTFRVVPRGAEGLIEILSKAKLPLP